MTPVEQAGIGKLITTQTFDNLELEINPVSSKADLLRYATIAYLKDLGWFEKPPPNNRMLGRQS